MKTKILIVVTLLILIIGCNDKNNEVEILKNYEFDYLAEEEVDTPVKFIDDKNHEKLNASLLEIGNELKNKNDNFPDMIDFHIRLFVSENGKIDYIKNLKKPDPKLELLINSFIRKMGDIFSQHNITPAVKNGITIKSRKDVKIGIENFSDTLRLYIPDFLENMPNFQFNIQNKSHFLIEVDKMPSPIGGIYAIQEKIKYPEIAKRAGIEGRVFVKAFIDENGNVAGSEIMKGIGAGCDEAALFAVKNTEFEPGRVNGKAVKVQITIPIMFKLN